MAKVKNLEPQEVVEILKDPKTIILDVRTLEEFEEGALPNAQLLPVDDLPENTALLPKDKTAQLLVYCAHGVRSLRATDFLQSLGYVNLFNIKGGLARFLEEVEN